MKQVKCSGCGLVVDVDGVDVSGGHYAYLGEQERNQPDGSRIRSMARVEKCGDWKAVRGGRPKTGAKEANEVHDVSGQG